MPIDPTPHFGEVMQPPPEHEFPKNKTSGKEPAEPDMAQRPSLPVHPEQMAADVEDEEDDPVVDSGPGITDGLHPLNKQRG